MSFIHFAISTDSINLDRPKTTSINGNQTKAPIDPQLKETVTRVFNASTPPSLEELMSQLADERVEEEKLNQQWLGSLKIEDLKLPLDEFENKCIYRDAKPPARRSIAQGISSAAIPKRERQTGALTIEELLEKVSKDSLDVVFDEYNQELLETLKKDLTNQSLGNDGTVKHVLLKAEQANCSGGSLEPLVRKNKANGGLGSFLTGIGRGIADTPKKSTVTNPIKAERNKEGSGILRAADINSV
ncbi:MAG: hypothetical protein NT065_03020 [Chlamydiae bacterium]|nr:hypothetical protein [Chlamydiota bacterium]